VTRFYDVEVLARRAAPPLRESYFERKHTSLQKALATVLPACNPGKEKVKKAEQLAFCMQHAPAQPLEAIREAAWQFLLAETRRAKGVKRLVKSLQQPFHELGGDQDAVYRGIERDEVRRAYFFAHNICAHLRPDLTPITETEVVMQVVGRTLPEGAIPSASFEFLRGWTIRHLRDCDAASNPWVARYGLDALQGHHPRGLEHILLCALEDRTKKRAVLRFVARAEWVCHLSPGDRFETAA